MLRAGFRRKAPDQRPNNISDRERGRAGVVAAAGFCGCGGLGEPCTPGCGRDGCGAGRMSIGGGSGGARCSAAGAADLGFGALAG